MPNTNAGQTIVTEIGNVIEEIIDKIILFLVFSFVAEIVIAKLIANTISQYKWKIIFFSLGIVIIFCSVILSVFAKLNQILQNPLITIEKVTAQDFMPVANYVGLPEELIDYLEPGFIDSGTPNGSPLGGNGLEYTYVTAGYLDSSYTMNFGRFHYAIDIVPSNNYLEYNQAYMKFKDIVMFATCSGNASSYIDGNGANYITLVCDGGKYMSTFVHNKYNFISPGKGTHVLAGQPIAVMGSTGNSTGPHIHYQIKNLETGQILNPFSFINIDNLNALVKQKYYEL
jgi:murein DD-endopeptidase MepM/ murein hydrolase activator NlpD